MCLYQWECFVIRSHANLQIMMVRKISGYKVKCMDVHGGGYQDTYFTDSDVKIDTWYGTMIHMGCQNWHWPTINTVLCGTKHHVLYLILNCSRICHYRHLLVIDTTTITSSSVTLFHPSTLTNYTLKLLH